MAWYIVCNFDKGKISLYHRTSLLELYCISACFLGLATHEPHFTIIREEFKPNKPRSCDLCGQMGHEMKDCQGLPKEKVGEVCY